MTKRISLVPATGLTSSYKKKNSLNTERWTVDVFNESRFICPDTLEALIKLNKLILLNKGKFYITDLLRSWETQAKSRSDYLAGKKSAYTAPAGSSFHNSGRAVDFSVKELEFENTNRKDWLTLLWGLAKPLGFKPIITIPDIDMSEAWHLDFPGEWSDAYSKLSYSEVAKCAMLDCGLWQKGSKDKIKRMFIQSQLIRLAYYEIGTVDGIFGQKTNKVLDFEGILSLDLDSAGEVLSKRA